MRHGVFVLSIVAASFGAACSSTSDPPPVPRVRLDERLAPGQTRAGTIALESELIGGPTAKGTIGDVKLYNDRIAVIIAQPGIARGFHPFGGTILDADQIRPEGEPGRSTFGEVVVGLDLAILVAEKIEIISDGTDGESRVRVTGSRGELPLFRSIFGGLLVPEDIRMEWSVDYILEPNADSLRIEHRMLSLESLEVSVGLPLVGFFFGTGARPFVEGSGFSPSKSASEAPYYAAIADGVSYLYGRPQSRVNLLFGESGLAVAGLGRAFALPPREETFITHYLIVGGDDFTSVQAKWRTIIGEPPGTVVRGRVEDEAQVAQPFARVHVLTATPVENDADYVSRVVADADGRYALTLPTGTYRVLAANDSRQHSAEQTLDVDSSVEEQIIELPRSGAVEVEIVGEDGRPLPAKISVEPVDVVASNLPSRFGERTEAAGLVYTDFAYTGAARIALAPGRYVAYVSRGGEYEVVERALEIVAGQTVSFQAALERTSSTPNWLTADVHVHAQLSPDSRDDYDFKVQAMAAENLELPISTDHEAIGDFGPAIETLGLGTWIRGIVGTEITTTTYGHFNAFPLEQDDTKPGNGRIDWFGRDPSELFALVRSISTNPFVQTNHPRSTSIGYFHLMGFDRDSFEAEGSGFSTNFDAIEVVNGCEQGTLDGDTVRDWFAFLNRGEKRYATASPDDHAAEAGALGYPVTYVRLPTDLPSEVEVEQVREAFKAGRLVVSCGPFVEMSIAQSQIGDVVDSSAGRLDVDARVSAPSWMDVDSLRLIVGGEVVREVALPEGRGDRFDGTLSATITPGRDTWAILWVTGDRDHGLWARGRPSFAFTNPIYIDGDGDGEFGVGRSPD